VIEGLRRLMSAFPLGALSKQAVDAVETINTLNTPIE
jgi:hypothetical protein